MADQEELTFFLSVVPFRQEILKVNAYVVSSIQAAADFHFAPDHGADFATPAVDAILARSQHEDLGNAPFIADDC